MFNKAIVVIILIVMVIITTNREVLTVLHHYYLVHPHLAFEKYNTNDVVLNSVQMFEVHSLISAKKTS